MGYAFHLLMQLQQIVALVNVQCFQMENNVRNDVAVQVSLHVPFTHHQHRGKQVVLDDGLPKVVYIRLPFGRHITMYGTYVRANLFLYIYILFACCTVFFQVQSSCLPKSQYLISSDSLDGKFLKIFHFPSFVRRAANAGRAYLRRFSLYSG